MRPREFKLQVCQKTLRKNTIRTLNGWRSFCRRQARHAARLRQQLLTLEKLHHPLEVLSTLHLALSLGLAPPLDFPTWMYQRNLSAWQREK